MFFKKNNFKLMNCRLKCKVVTANDKNYIFDLEKKTGELKDILIASTLFNAEDNRLKTKLKIERTGMFADLDIL